MTPWGMPMELEQRVGALPYEEPGRHPYGPAPSWNWRPVGEAAGETTALQTLVVGSAEPATISAALDALATAVRKLPGTFEYRWLRSGISPGSFVAYGRFADAVSAVSASEAARASLVGFGRFSSDVLINRPDTAAPIGSTTGK